MADDPRTAKRVNDEPVAASSRRAASSETQDFEHVPVMVEEIVALVAELPAGVFVDATLGGAGHSVEILTSCPQLELVGIDRDPIALEVAAGRLASFGERVRIERARFDQLPEILDRLDVDIISGFLFDLGVSSPQLDEAGRGFSFRHDGPLDMRMDPDSPLTAAVVVNTFEHGELASIIRRHGDERFAGRIASAIIASRPINTTTELAEIVVNAIPAAARRTGGHPAKRTFQALRIHVNDELAVLRPALESALDVLAVDGRGLVLTYHSGEDRIVKDVIRGRSTADVPPGIPVPATDPEFVALRPLSRRPSEAEQDRNPRSASARLRGIERVRREVAA